MFVKFIDLDKKFQVICLLLINVYIINKKLFYINNASITNIKEFFHVNPFVDLFNSNIERKKTILIIELYGFHHECTPGYTKYFIDLGYNVHILMKNVGISAFSLFPKIKNIQLFIFQKLSQIKNNTKNLSMIIKKYAFILLQTTSLNRKKLYNKLGLFKVNNSFFIIHQFSSKVKTLINYSKQNRIWTLNKISNGLEVNPHFFGYIFKRNKNDKIKFFMTSTIKRNYKYIVQTVERLKEDNFDFEIIISGRTNKFNSESIPKSIINYFVFSFYVPYSKLYLLVESSDYIIIPLDPKDDNDKLYNKIKVTGSIQLAYGFLKPPIIHKEFASFYSLNIRNSLLYNDLNLYNIMRKAIQLNKANYEKMQDNLLSTSKEIYERSLNNIKKALNKF